jgi:ribonuclease VapC
MVIDSSALMAIIGSESDAEFFEAAIANTPRRLISTATVVEVGIIVLARYGDVGSSDFDLLLHKAEVIQVSVTERHAQMARRAFQRFGKGRHPAALNFGDCFPYALAMSEGEPLLYKGSDFSLTDVISFGV